MKVGTHAQEDLAAIIERKQREIDQAGMAMWGYGGNTCHPRTVQPFARAHVAGGNPVVLAMQPMKSKHFADPVRAEEYSETGELWTPIPDQINVLGSKYALCISSLETVDANLSLSETRVGAGRSKGREGNRYVGGRVDKACLEVVGESTPIAKGSVPIRLVAELTEPYAVFLRI